MERFSGFWANKLAVVRQTRIMTPRKVDFAKSKLKIRGNISAEKGRINRNFISLTAGKVGVEYVLNLFRSCVVVCVTKHLSKKVGIAVS